MECFRPCTLAFVAMDGRSVYARLIELLGQLVSTVFGPREDNHLLPELTADQVRQQIGLSFLVDGMHHLFDEIDR